MKTLVAAILLALLAACQSAPKLEEDARYVKLARVVDKHEFTELERKQAQAALPRDSSVGVGVSVGGGNSGGFGFGGVMLGMGSRVGARDEPPQIAHGAIRYTVQPQRSQKRIEVMSYAQHQVGDCVKVLTEHPSAYPRFFELKPGEHCE